MLFALAETIYLVRPATARSTVAVYTDGGGMKSVGPCRPVLDVVAEIFRDNPQAEVILVQPVVAAGE